jgi:phage-related minor tail protein
MQDTMNTLSLETEKLRREMAGLNRLADNFGQTMVRAFAGAIIHGRKLSDVLKGLALSLAGQALSSALKPLGGLLGNIFASARGNVVTPFAKGGIVNSPTLFPLRGGAGLMGEAGAEAIMPLR